MAMLKNNNQEIVKKIGKRTLAKNKTRNIFVIMAIVLTTFMFTTVFTIGFSLVKNLSTMMLRQQGTKSTIFLPEPDKDQIEKVKEVKSLYAAGLKIQTGAADILGTENKILLDWYDEVEFNDNFQPAVSDINGTYPTEADEIMLSKSALDALKIDKPEKGMNIKLKQGLFKLSGWFTDYAYHSGGYQGFISDAYIEKTGLTVEKDGILCMSAKPGKQDEVLSSLSKLKLREGQDIKSGYDIQEENSNSASVTAIVILLISFIIVISGYLLIYNVMYISITKDIRFYGMLKTVGTSPSQIKKIVLHQAASLSVIGIPIGIILGIIVSFAVVPFALKITGSYGSSAPMPSDISFNPLIYIGTILFAILTVFASCRKPSKLAGKVSPVEALKYNGINNVKYKTRKGTDGGKLYKMAYRNVFREKKRAIMVFASLFMGTIAFLSVNTFLGCLKLENYVKFYLTNDYTIYTNSDDPALAKKEAKIIEEKIKNIDGITNIHVNRSADTVFEFDEKTFKPFFENSPFDEKELQTIIDSYKNAKENKDKYQSPVVSVSSDMMKLYNTKAKQKIDIERFEKGEICLLGFVSTEEQSDYMLGRKITLKDIESGKKKTLEIGSCPTIDDRYGINVGYYWMKSAAPDIVLISDTALNEFCDNPSIDNIIADCNPEAESFVTPKIKEAVKTSASVLQTEIKSELMSEFVSSMSAMNILGGGISIVLILIGIINFINVMLTGVYTRKGELSVMESVGMTKKQVKKMLVFEGGYYGLITIALILTIGNALVYKIANFTQDIADYAVFHYPIVLMFIIIVVIMSICIIVPMAIYHTVSKESITERLRQ